MYKILTFIILSTPILKVYASNYHDPGIPVSDPPAHVFTQNLSQSDEPIRQIFDYRGIEREYYVRLPKDFNSKQKYWALVAVHGGGSNGKTFWLAKDLRLAADKIGLRVIVISPSFLKEDPNSQRFPVLGEGSFFKHMIDDVNTKYLLQTKILLTGSSREAFMVTAPKFRATSRR